MKIDCIITTLILSLACSCFGQNQGGSAPSTAIPVPSQLKTFMPKRHNEKIKEAKERQIDLVMIGTNHMHLPKKGYTPDTPEDIFTGIPAVVVEIRTRLPDSKLIVFSVFPRGPEAAQERAEAVNAMLPQLADHKHVFHMDINHVFLGEGGALNKALYKGDQLHLSLQGYEAWAKVLLPLLEGAAVARLR